MLQKLVDDADHLDVLAQVFDAGPQTADAADIELDAHAGVGGFIQRLDDLRIHQGVHLGADQTRFIRRAAHGLAPDQAQQLAPHAEGRHLDLVPFRRQRVPRHHVEEGRDISGDRFITGEKSDIGINARRTGVVIAGGEVHVAFDAFTLPADHQTRFGVRLVARDAVQDRGAGADQPPRPLDIVLFIKTGLELDQRRHPLAFLGGALQGAQHGGVRVGPIQRLFDREHIRIIRRRLEETGDRVVGLVGMEN